MMACEVRKSRLEAIVPNYIAIEDLRKEVQIPTGGTGSRTLHQSDRAKVVLFGLAAGQEISRHTAGPAAMVQIVEGQVRFTVDGEERELSADSWVFMEADLSHAVYARTDAVMLVTLLL